MRGMVKSITKNRAFGFIAADKKEYFFHRDDFSGHWEDLVSDFLSGAQIPVEFVIVENNIKGPRAADVKRTDFPNEA